MANMKRADMRLDDETDKLMEKLSRHLGVNRTSVVKLAIRELAKKERIMGNAVLSEALEKFLASGDFKAGVIASTKASWDGSGYSVELLPDGSWRVLWDNQIGNRYATPGVILALPTFTDDDTYQEAVYGDNPISEEEYFGLCFGNEGEDLAEELRRALRG